MKKIINMMIFLTIFTYSQDNNNGVGSGSSSTSEEAKTLGMTEENYTFVSALMGGLMGSIFSLSIISLVKK